MKLRNKHLFTMGYVEFTGLGGFQEKFISEIIKENIPIWSISQTKAEITAAIHPKYYLKVARISRKFGIKTRIKSRHGLSFKIYPYRKRWGLVLGGLCCTGVIAVLSSFVWDISVSGNDKLSTPQIRRILSDVGISTGVQRLSFDSNACEIKAKLLLDNLAWISIEREGSRVYVKVSERVVADEPDVPITTPCNIVADFDGQLIKAEVFKGTLAANKGDGIRKGQLLVSGAVADGGGNMLYLHADGNFIAQCKEEHEFYIPFSSTEKIADGAVYTKNYALIFGYVIPLFWSDEEIDFNNISYHEETQNTTILGITTPFKIRTGYYTDYSEKKVTRTNNDIINLLNKQEEDYAENFLSDTIIVNVEKKFHPEEDGIRLKVIYTIQKEIGIKKEISVFYEKIPLDS